MSQNRTQIDGGANNVRQQQPGEVVLDQFKLIPLATIGAGTLLPGHILSGVLNRTGPTGAYSDTWPSASSILAASPQLSVGDSFSVLVRNTVAFAMTSVAGSGIVLGANTDIAASFVRRYLLTVLGDGQDQILQITTTSASPVLTGLTPAQAVQLRVGQGITGTGIPANSYIIGVNGTSGAVTLNANATASATVAGTFFARIKLDGLYTAAL